MNLLHARAFAVSGAIILTLTAQMHGAMDIEPVGGNVDLSAGVTTNMNGISIAFNSTDGEFMVAWYDSRVSGQNNIYAQRVDAADGSTLAGNATIIAGSPSQSDSAIAYNPTDNRYLVSWRNQSGAPGSAGFNHTFGRLVGADGVPVSGPVDLANSGLEPTMTYNPVSNEFFVEARNFAGGGPGGIRARRITAAGLPTGPDISLSAAGAPAPAGQVAYDSNNNRYLGTWRNQVDGDLRGRIIDAAGTPLTAEFIISATFPNSGLAGSLAFDPVNDRYLAVLGTFSGGPIIGQLVNSDGTLSGGNFTVHDTAANVNPFVAYDTANHVFLVAWTANGAVTAKLLDEDGNQLGDDLTVAAGSGIGAPRIAADSNAGGFLVAWKDNRDAGQTDVYSQLIEVVSDECSADLDGDGEVGAPDLAIVLGNWGVCEACEADLDEDGNVGAADLAILLGNWGPC